MSSKWSRLAVVALLVVVASSAHALPPPPPPTIPELCNAYVSASIVKLGILAGLVMGGFFGFWLIKKTFVWAGKIG